MDGCQLSNIPAWVDITGKLMHDCAAALLPGDCTVVSVCLTAASGDSETVPSDDGNPVKLFNPPF